MSVFDGLVGQPHVRTQLERAAAASRELAEGSRFDSDSAMAQAWLVTGPPGSGRSIAARMLAAALECTGERPGCGTCHECTTTMTGVNPDVELVATRGVSITIDEVRELVGHAYVTPGTGRWRVIIIEDADRMAERTTNVLLKAIEEPPPFTVWILCTPSAEDVLPTIRSRCRAVSLQVPDAREVAALLESEGVEPELALNAAFAAQSHIGRARALAVDPEAAEERRYVLREVLGIRSTGDAVLAAHRIVNYPPSPAGGKKASKGRNAEVPAEVRAGIGSLVAQLEAGPEAAESLASEWVTIMGEFDISAYQARAFLVERFRLRRDLGIGDDARIPPTLRSQVKALAEDQKRRATRTKRDRLDRALVDVMSLYRDILSVQLGADVELVNRDFAAEIRAAAADSTTEQSIRRMDAIALTRERIAGNVPPLLAFEAMLISARPQG